MISFFLCFAMVATLVASGICAIEVGNVKPGGQSEMRKVKWGM